MNGDEIRLNQVITNLLLNAADFSDCGGEVQLLSRRLVSTNVSLGERSGSG